MDKQSKNTGMSPQNLMLWLGYLGLVPFIVPVVEMSRASLSPSGFSSASIGGLYAPYIFITYSAVILSFLAGLLWQKSRSLTSAKQRRVILVFSNLAALSGWSSLLIMYFSVLGTLMSLSLLICGFMLTLLAERAIEKDIVDDSYWNMRITLTLIVIALHALCLMLMIKDL
jgi:hypothetical protein